MGSVTGGGRFYALHACLVLSVLLALLWFVEGQMKEAAIRQERGRLETAALLVKRIIENSGAGEGTKASRDGAVREACRGLGGLSQARLEVTGSDGRIIADILPDNSRPGREGAVTTTVPLNLGRETGFLTFSADPEDVRAALPLVAVRLVLASLVAGLLGFGTAVSVFRRFSVPLRRLTEGVEPFSRGELERRLPSAASGELRELTDTLNRMASTLHRRIRETVRERGEMEAVLTSMVEGVVAVDSDRKVISLNRAAAALFEVDAVRVKGKNLFEIIHHGDLLDFIAETLETGREGEREITHSAADDTFLQVHGSPLKDARGEAIGVLAVLNDVTRIRKLESIRRDFVLNASHEIRTPVTAIKGFVETLLEGAMDDRENVERFLKIIATHAERLHAIVEDLLDLSRIEKEAERGDLVFARESLQTVASEALNVCRPKAQAKGIRLDCECAENVKASINASLLVQAVVNLVDNAIKYSEAGKTVRIFCGIEEPWAVIRVEDNGAGIARQHLPRLFERFYRVDKARSRSIGGTGLGLAIVKHIVQAHGGSVIVSSELGSGSVFTIYLRQRKV